MGFDYDFTLASYKHTLQSLIYDRAKQYLLERLNYPEALSSRSYDRNFAIRGLVFDQRRGVLLKLSYSQAISPDTAFLGRRRLSADELRELYGEALHLDASYVTEHTKPLNDLFSLSEACLLADVVQLAVDLDIPFDPAALGEDVSRAIAWVHISGTMHDEVGADPATYLHPSPHLGDLLRGARASGKSLFLLTNSSFDFVDKGMRFLVGHSWRQHFDVVIASAQKPHFYTRDAPFRAFSENGGFVKWSAAGRHDVERGKVLIGGSLSALTQLTGWSGKRVLYVGDHVLTDLRGPRRKAGWRTAAIVRELEHELAVMGGDEYARLRARSMSVDAALRSVQQRGASSFRAAEDVTATLDALEGERERIRTQMFGLFNENFGSIWRHRSDSTAFSFAVKQHVDLYTSRLEHLLGCDAHHRFYPTRCKLLPHDPDPF